MSTDDKENDVSEKDAEKETAEEKAAAGEGPVDAKVAAETTHSEFADEPLVSEPDRPNVAMIAIATFAICATIVIVVIGVYEFFGQTFQAEVAKKQLTWEDPLKRDQLAWEQARLTKYQWVDKEKGVVRIPVARARELVLASYGKMPAYEPGKAAPAASAPAPEGSATPAPEGSAAPAGSEVPPAGSASTMPAPSGSAPAAPSGSAPAAPPAASSAPAPAPH